MASNIYQRSKNFIVKSKRIHKNKYHYDLVEYINTKTSVIIICPIHGAFNQTPEKHINMKGCPTCGGTKKLSNDEFVTKAKQVHGGKYNYTLTNYIGSLKYVQITCAEHGTFKQLPKYHLRGHGCPKCGNNTTTKDSEGQ